MRVECDACKTLVVATFAADGGRVSATCSSCGVVMTTPVARPAAPAPAPASGEGAERDGARCPKCTTTRRGEPACPRCGLAADKMASYADVRDAAIPSEVRASWDQLLERWDDEARHDALWTLVRANGCYGWAAGRYRATSVERPDDPIAARRLEAIRRATEATMVATASVRRDEKSPYRATTAVLALLIVMLVIGLVYAVIHSMQTDPQPGSGEPDNAVRVRGREWPNRSVIAVEPPGRRGATRVRTRRYGTEEQRRQPGWIGREDERVGLSRPLR